MDGPQKGRPTVISIPPHAQILQKLLRIIQVRLLPFRVMEFPWINLQPDLHIKQIDPHQRRHFARLLHSPALFGFILRLAETASARNSML